MKIRDMSGPERKTKIEEAKIHESTWSKGVEYFDVRELARWLPWEKANIRKLLRSGKIKGRKVKKEWYVSRENLYRFLRGE
ncbi:hypothetical protein ES705_26817 [subsurface metagenome]